MSVEAPPGTGDGAGAGSGSGDGSGDVSVVEWTQSEPQEFTPKHRADSAVPPPVTSFAPTARGLRVARLERRRRRWRSAALYVAAFVFVAAGFVFVLPRGGHHPGAGSHVPAGPLPSSVAWALSWTTPGSGGSLAIVGVPPGIDATAVVAPDDAHVDLPSGAPLTVGAAASSGPAAIETAQALLNRRVGHYLVSTPQDIGALVDRLGPITFGAQGSIIVGGVAIGPGETTANGAQVQAYLTQGTGVEEWVRWEDVLSGILDAPSKPTAFVPSLGASDAMTIVGGLLAGAHGATVVDLPTTHELGLLKVDTAGVATMVQTAFGTSVGGLVRVIVQNGNGLPGMGAQVGELLAPYGFRVVDSQNAGSFTEPQTKILASGQSYLSWAEKAQQVLGAGKVYLDGQPSGIADVTIVVGKDFGTG